LTGFSYVVDEHIGLMLRNNLPNYACWHVRQIVSRLKTRPWAALRLFALMPLSLLKAALIISTLGKVFSQCGLFA